MMLCVQHPLCKSLNYDRKMATCWLFDLDQRNSSNQLIVAQDVDYYENSCLISESKFLSIMMKNDSIFQSVAPLR